MKRVLITGVTGFIGRNLAKRLLNDGYQVIGSSRRNANEKLFASDGYEQIVLDYTVTDIPQVDAVIHVAANTQMWGNYQDFYRDNVVATTSLLNAAIKCGSKAFLYISTPSVVAGPYHREGVNEDFPVNLDNAHYPKTKGIAEKVVLATDQSKIKTIALRPHMVFGPDDTNFLRRLYEKRKSLVQIGRDPVVDLTHVDDCVECISLALDKLLGESSEVAGKAFFVTSGDPVKLWDFVNVFLELKGANKITKKVSYGLARFLAKIFELKGALTNKEPRLTSFLVDELHFDHYYSIDRARKLLGFNPQGSIIDKLKSSVG